MNFYLSKILNTRVYNKSKEKIGRVEDIVVTEINKPHPKVRGLLIKRGLNKESVFIPNGDIELFSPKSVKLNTDIVDLAPFMQRDDEVLLVKNIYDKQIVDIDDQRLTRVNDLLLEEEKNVVRLKGVDVSVLGLLSRLNIPQVLHLLKRNVVDWEDVQFLGGPNPMKFNVQFKKLELLHPVDIGRIIFEGPGYKQGSRVLSSLEDPIAADIIERLSPKLQKNLIESMKVEDVADVIRHMPPDKAADLLLTLGGDYLKKILPHLEQTDAEKIQGLLSYSEHMTGAHMTTDYLVIPADVTVEEAMKLIRKLDEHPDFMNYAYVLENKLSNKLVGVMGSNEFFRAELRSRVSSIMETNLITTNPTDPVTKSLRKMYEYNLFALPVLNNDTDRIMVGIINFQQAAKLYLPKSWKVQISN